MLDTPHAFIFLAEREGYPSQTVPPLWMRTVALLVDSAPKQNYFYITRSVLLASGFPFLICFDSLQQD